MREHEDRPRELVAVRRDPPVRVVDHLEHALAHDDGSGLVQRTTNHVVVGFTQHPGVVGAPIAMSFRPGHHPGEDALAALTQWNAGARVRPGDESVE